MSRVTSKIKERVPASLLANADQFKHAAGGLVQKARLSYRSGSGNSNSSNNNNNNNRLSPTPSLAVVPIGPSTSTTSVTEEEQDDFDEDLNEAVRVIDSISAEELLNTAPLSTVTATSSALPLDLSPPQRDNDAISNYNDEIDGSSDLLRRMVLDLIDEALPSDFNGKPPPLPSR